MNQFVKSILVFLVLFILFFTGFTFGVSYLWHQGGFRWVYQFVVSFGLLACAFYFFIVSRGNVAQRIVWGLVFLILSPISYFVSNIVFWGASMPTITVPRSPATYYGRGLRVPVRFLMEAQIAPGVPVWLMAVLGLLVGNGVFIAKGVPRRRAVGGDILLIAWIVLMYFIAYSRRW